MHLQLDPDEFKDLIRQVVGEVLTAIDWPAGRLALTEEEAALACGVGRHVLRDLRLAGKIRGRKLGKKTVYQRSDLLAALCTIDVDGLDGSSVNYQSTRKR